MASEDSLNDVSDLTDAGEGNESNPSIYILAKVGQPIKYVAEINHYSMPLHVFGCLPNNDGNLASGYCKNGHELVAGETYIIHGEAMVGEKTLAHHREVIVIINKHEQATETTTTFGTPDFEIQPATVKAVDLDTRQVKLSWMFKNEDLDMDSKQHIVMGVDPQLREMLPGKDEEDVESVFHTDLPFYKGQEVGVFGKIISFGVTPRFEISSFTDRAVWNAYAEAATDDEKSEEDESNETRFDEDGLEDGTSNKGKAVEANDANDR